MADDNCGRIERLVAEHLERIGDSEDGWTIRYLDPSSGRLWEMTHPQSHLHGGGPPMLRCLDPGTSSTAAGYRRAVSARAVAAAWSSSSMNSTLPVQVS
ncbi:MAG: immunity 27 family protein [Phycisphaerales bacterium]|nr:hypothetical protein [Planctomycetota bacterium]MCH8509947.1 immunity 27 family protein [Phycisphaerales bacterium]